MKKFNTAVILFAAFFLLTIAAHSQQKKITFTWNPFSFIEDDAGFTPGIDCNIGKRTNLLADAGIILYNLISDPESNGVQNTQLGYKLKPEFRVYFNENTVAQGFFASVELMYKHVSYTRYNALDILDNMGNLVYRDYSGYKIKKDVYGCSIKMGWRIYFSKKYRLGMDLYGGLGARHKNFAVRDLPPGASFNRSFFTANRFNPYWQEGGTVSLPAGIKLIWRLR